MGKKKEMSKHVSADGNQGDNVSWSGGGGGGAAAKAKKGPDFKGDRKAADLDSADEADKIETVSLDLRLKIQQARLAKKKSQADVAKKINEKPQTINEYESGKAVPNQQVLGKLERILGAKLRGGAKKKK